MVLEIGRWLIDLTEDYSQFFDACHWYTYRVAHIEFERDVVLGGWEASIALLGLGIRVRWNHTETDALREVRRRMDEIKKT